MKQRNAFERRACPSSSVARHRQSRRVLLAQTYIKDEPLAVEGQSWWINRVPLSGRYAPPDESFSVTDFS